MVNSASKNKAALPSGEECGLAESKIMKEGSSVILPSPSPFPCLSFLQIGGYASLTMLKPLTVWITINYGKLLMEILDQPPYLPLVKPVCKSSSNSQNQTWKNGLVQNWERSMSRLYIVTLLI